jgi:signal transduction histidine kinase
LIVGQRKISLQLPILYYLLASHIRCLTFLVSYYSRSHFRSHFRSRFHALRRQRVTFVKKYLLVSSKDRAMEMVATGLKKERDAATVTVDELQVTISGAGHDMKSPITGLVLAVESVVTTLQTELLHCAAPPSAATEQAMRTCIDAYGTIMHLSMIVNRSVDYCKIRADLNLTPTLQPVHLVDCIQQVIGCYASDAGMSIVLKDIPTGVPAEGITDASWLQDNLLCMVGNACKYSERSRVQSVDAIIVVVRMVVVGGRKLIEIVVKDCGVVLAPAVLQAFFMRPVMFRREAVGGMGLGMCCLAARVKALGGTYGARVRSDHVPGTAVWFRIPFEPCKDGQKAARSTLCVHQPTSEVEHSSRTRRVSGAPDLLARVPQAPGSVASATKSIADKPLNGLAILVVDDAPSIVKMVVRQLINAGATVESAKDGREGVEVIKAATAAFDIVITDIQVCSCSLPSPFSYHSIIMPTLLNSYPPTSTSASTPVVH